jgi:hypothetical protein
MVYGICDPCASPFDLMLTDAQFAELQLAAYAYDGKPFAWDWICDQTKFANTYAGLKIVDGVQVIVMPGTGGGVSETETQRQWFLNFSAWPQPIDHPQFGWVEAGFYDEMEPFTAVLLPHLDRTKPIAGIGHSRGAAQILIVAGLLKAQGVTIDLAVAFAPPRPGGSEFAAYIADINKTLYRTVGSEAPGHDLVTDVPFWPAEEPGPLTDLTVTPLPHDDWLAFRYHHIQLYCQGLTATGA